MDENFEKGYEYICNNLAGATGIAVSQSWLESVNQAIETTADNINAQAVNHGNLGIDQLQGFVNEAWHEGSFNVNARIHGSASVAKMPESTALGSSDVTVTDRSGAQHEFSLKSYKDANGAVRAQSETRWERFNNNAKKMDMDVQDYMKANPDKVVGDIKMSMYQNQGKVISTEQLETARALLKRKLDRLEGNQEPTSETAIQIARYKEVLATITDVVKDGKGTESVKLTHQQAIDLAKAAQKGEVDKELLKECGLDVNKLVDASDIMQEAMKAGLTAAALSALFSMAPTIVNGISKLIAEGEIDIDELKHAGLNSLKSGARGFLNGSITGAINICCQTGKFGEALTSVDPSMVSALVVITISTIESAIDLSAGRIDKSEMARRMMRLYVTTAFSYAGGVALTAIFEGFPFAYLVGSLVGSVIGGLVYTATEKLLISFCIDSGCTFFGIVDQNYELPQEVIENLGLDIFEFEKIETNEFHYEVFQPNTFSFNSFEYEHFGIKLLKRGLIGVYSIGYTS